MGKQSKKKAKRKIKDYKEKKKKMGEELHDTTNSSTEKLRDKTDLSTENETIDIESDSTDDEGESMDTGNVDELLNKRIPDSPPMKKTKLADEKDPNDSTQHQEFENIGNTSSHNKDQATTSELVFGESVHPTTASFAFSSFWEDGAIDVEKSLNTQNKDKQLSHERNNESCDTENAYSETGKGSNFSFLDMLMDNEYTHNSMNRYNTRSQKRVCSHKSQITQPINVGHVHQYKKPASIKSRIDAEITSKYPHFVEIGSSEQSTVEINVNVAVPSNLLNNEDRLVMICGHQHLGNWKNPLAELTKTNIEEKFEIYSGNIRIPAKIRKIIQYKYLVLDESGVKFWEVLNGKHVEENRVLCDFTKDCERKHYQYDDVFLPEKDKSPKILEWLKSFFLKKEEDIFSSCLPDVFNYYLQKIFDGDQKHMLYMIMDLYTSFFAAKSFYEHKLSSWKKFSNQEIFFDAIRIQLGVITSVIANPEFDFDVRIKRYRDVILILCGLVKSGCNLNAFLVPLCDTLSLYPFYDARTVLKEKLKVELKDHAPLVSECLKDFTKKVLQASDNKLEEKWIDLFVLSYIFNEESIQKLFLRNSRFIESVLKNIDNIKKTFELDISLMNKVISSMQSQHIELALKAKCFDNCLIIQRMKEIICDGEINSDGQKMLCPALDVFSEYENQLTEWEFMALLDVLCATLKYWKWEKFYMFFISINKVLQSFDVSSLNNTNLQSYQEYVNDIAVSLKYGPSFFYSAYSASNQLKVFDIFVSWKTHENERNLISESSRYILKEHLRSMNKRHYTFIYNSLNLEKICNGVQIILFDFMNDIVNRENLSKRCMDFYELVKASPNSLKSYCHCVTQLWSNVQGNTSDMLKEIVGYGLLNHFLAKAGEVEQLKDVRGEIIQSVKGLLDRILNDTLEVKYARMIIAKKHHYVNLCKTLNIFDGENRDLNNKIDLFERHLNRFDICWKSVMNFIHFISSSNFVDVAIELHTQLSIENFPMVQFANQSIILNHFHLNEDDLDVLMNADKCHIYHHALFLKMYQENVKDDSTITSISSVLEDVVSPALVEVKELAMKIQSENVNADEIKTFFGTIHLNVLEKELESYFKFFKFECSKYDFKMLLSKIDCFKKFEKVICRAGDILEMKEKLEMNGDFRYIEDIYKKREGSQHLLLKEVNEDLVKHAAMLDEISEDGKMFLNTVSNCLNLIAWVRTELKDRNELRKFIDFISNSCETSFEIQRVRCFELACKGLDKLIYDTNEESGFKDLVQSIPMEINQSIEDLIKAIIDTNRHLEWFKRSFESLGSVVETAFMKVQDINRRGIYIVCLNLKDYMNNDMLEDYVIELVVTDKVDAKINDGLNTLTGEKFDDIFLNDEEGDMDEETSAKKNKVYKCRDIENLQSLLVLLGDNQVDNNKAQERNYFIEVCHNMRKLAKVFVNLIQDGCLRMFDVQFVFKCNVEDLLSRDLLIDDTIAEIERLSGEQNEYRCKMEKLRLEEPLLNYFSTKQIVLLQKYTANVLNNVDDKSLAYRATTLLLSIYDNIDERKIKNVLNRIPLQRQLLSSEVSNSETYFGEMTKSDFNRIINTMLERGVSEDVAYASVAAVQPFDDSKALSWCYEEATDLESNKIDALREEGRKIIDNLMDINDEKESPSSDLINDDNASNKTEVSFLLLEQLVFFLNQLKANCQDKSLENVKKLSLEARPYLFTLEQDAVVKMVLHMYYENFQKLPPSRNVLFCTKQTNIEEIELLIRRATLNDQQIFTLMFIEELDFLVTKYAVTCLQEKLNLGLKSPLLMFCSSEKEYSNLLVSSFTAYHCNLSTNIVSDMVDGNFRKCLSVDVNTKQASVLDVTVERSVYSVITSTEAGMGKSFKIQQQSELLKQNILQAERVQEDVITKITVPIHGNHVNIDEITNLLIEREEQLSNTYPKIIHFDISPTISSGLESFLFNLVVLGCIQNKNGVQWRRRKIDAVMLEVTLSEAFSTLHKSNILRMLPKFTCQHPTASGASGLNVETFRSEQYQRVYQYLAAYDAGQDLNNVSYNCNPFGNTRHCLSTIVRHCGIQNPSWMEVSNFVKFFNQQLRDCEESSFCNNSIPVNQEIISGFKSFVVKFCLEMSKDFATRSIAANKDLLPGNNDLVQLKRKWENSIHPYLFFNHDHSSFSFVGFNIDQNGNLLDPREGRLILRNVMSPQLYQGLSIQLRMERDYIDFNTRFDLLSKEVKIKLLCRVMGVEYYYGIDPDPSFVLTNDNVQKILAIHMRFRANIPVIMSGETGCGKTKLIKYMTALIASGKKNIQNLVLAKIHGGTTFEKIKDYFEQAIQIAKNNMQQTQEIGGIDTVLFFDECNTSEAVGLIKEVMIDSRCFGKSVNFEENRLKIVAAINPYRRHSQHMIKKLECSGLGYYNENEDELERLGNIPLRQLVYRVHKLPESLKSIVWDYGHLNEESEKAYIEKIVLKEMMLTIQDQKQLVELLSYSQQYMRKQKDECSFVSLRDVERAIKVLKWFLAKSGLFQCNSHSNVRTDLQVATLLALNVCYISRLEKRQPFFDKLLGRYSMRDMLLIERIEKNVAEQMVLEKNIALNKALCENIFMMLVCIELRIPLFVVGKPGSSKSLAKTIIQESMQGKLSKSKFCHSFKQVFMASYQCSAMSTAEGIISTFKQCSEYQEGKNLDEFASVVVLDEVGLAEDSPRMPLKALHPLLEDGTDCSEDLALDERRKNVMRPAFIGLSNFAIDPAKMNRGIMLSHPIPDIIQLYKTASELCRSDSVIKESLDELLRMLARGYLSVYKKQKSNKKLENCKKMEFFGLRDFYSLVKEIFCMGRQRRGVPTLNNIKIAVQRNFSGLENFDSWSIFEKELRGLQLKDTDEQDNVLPIDLIKHSLKRQCPCYGDVEKLVKGSLNKCYNSRYLLLMTEELSALDTVKQILLDKKENVDIIFGSSFPKDQEFQQLYKDITHIKMCMETGRTVVLLNMENLYESLYDALNQYYVYFGGQKYVDLGLGVHRVKCRVHDNFRLIVIADVNTVYSVFPIPLINRLEKHFVLPSLNMSQQQIKVAQELSRWVVEFADSNNIIRRQINASQVLPGYDENNTLSLVTKIWDDTLEEEQILAKSKSHLIHAATPDSIIRYSCDTQNTSAFDVFSEYMDDPRHLSLMNYISSLKHVDAPSVFSQITTFSRLLSDNDVSDKEICLLHLKEFHTEASFRNRLRHAANSNEKVASSSYIVIQCANMEEQHNLINCAKHICVEFHKAEQERYDCKLFFIFILQLRHTDSFLKTWQSNWTTFHIDELKRTESAIVKFYDKKLSEMFDNQISNWEDILQLTRSCIQSSIKDLNDEKKMDTESIKIKIKNLIDMLSPTEAGDCKFAAKLFAFIKEGLVDKEKLEYCDGEKKVCANWVKKQANNQCEKANYSTFNKSLIHTIEESVKPLLTKFLIMCDVNNNLLLMKPDNEKWWSLFGQEIYKVVDQQENSVSFKCLFPFSSHLVSLVDKIAEVFSFEETIRQKVERLVSALNEQLQHLDISQEEERNFVHDFLCLKLQSSNYTVMPILVQALHDQVKFQEPSNSLNCFITFVKLVYDQIEVRFNFAMRIANVKKLDWRNVNCCYDKREFTADMMVLRAFITSLWPDTEFKLLYGKKGVEWLVSFKKVKPVMKSICEFYQTNGFREISAAVFDIERLRWTKICILQLYIEAVIRDVKKIDQFLLEDFFKVVNKLEDNMESRESWQSIQSLLIHLQVTMTSNDEMEVDDIPLQQLFTSFYIELVTQFCFNREDGLKVDEEVIEMMMEHVFSNNKKSTKIFSPMRDYKIDESYTVRSFLLKQLLKMKKTSQLNELLEYSLDVVSEQGKTENYWAICNLFLYCCEDFTTIKNCYRDDASKSKHCISLLENVFPDIVRCNQVNAKNLKSLAEVRYALTFACNYLHKVYLTDKAEEDLKFQTETLFSLVKNVCVENEAHYFCLRHIIKRYGTQELDEIVEKSGFSWLKLKYNEEESSRQDLFLVYGQDYKAFRERIQDAMVEGKTISELQKDMKEVAQNIQNISLLREIVIGATDNKLKRSFCNVSSLQQCSNEVLQVINNSDEAMSELLLHLHVLMIAQNNATDIIRLFSRSAQEVKNFFLPAMPSDNFEEIRNARPADGNWVMYECPNGHPYVITNCGQPNQSYTCNVCNARIGSHVEGSGQLSTNNRTVQARDTTKSGYCVGLPDDRSMDGTTERALQSLSVALQRFIIHLSLYRLSIVDPQAAIQCITLPVQGVQDVRKFFYEHLQTDIRLLSQKLSKNSNDVMILFHLFLKHLNTSTWTYQGDLIQQLSSKDGRVMFENDFDRHVVSPFLQTFENDLVEAQRAILNDMDKSRDPKFRKLHHLNIPKCPETEGVELLNNWKLWQNHRTVSYSHFCNFTEQHLNRSVENGDQLKVLQQFLQQEEQFQLVQTLPKLIRLQKLIFSKMNYRHLKDSISNMEAIKAQQLFTGEEKNEFKKLLSCFCSTWNATHKFLIEYRRFRGDKDSLPRILKTDSSLEYFICSTSGKGVCAMLLIDYLAFLQHDFLDTWKSYDVLKFNMFNRVNVMSITESDVVNYSRERDLLPLLYSHCNYAVEIGRGMNIEYDLQQIEKKLMEKIFFGTSLIDIVIEQFVYLDDIRTSEKFNRFSKAIAQEKISSQDSKQVCYELSDMTDLTNTLNAVEIAIGFLSVTHGEGDMKLKNYVENILQMNIDIYLKSPRCQLLKVKHLKSLWLTLTVERCLRMYRSNKMAFDLNTSLRVTMDKNLQKSVKEKLQHHLVRPLIELLTEYIIFKLDNPEHVDFGLFDALQIYEDVSEKEEKIISDELLELPVSLKHSYNMWKILADFTFQQ